MNRRTICWIAFLMIGCMVVAQPTLAQTNPLCAEVSSKLFVDWPQFHSDQCRTGYNRNEFLLSPATVGNLTLDWRYTTGSMSDYSYSSPAVANGVVYFGSGDDNVYALNAATGALLWKHTAGNSVVGPWINSSPAVANGVVYVGGNDENWGYVYALNAATGALLWKYTAESSVESSPTVVNGVVYVGGDGLRWGYVYALNATTGTLVWERLTPGEVSSCLRRLWSTA